MSCHLPHRLTRIHRAVSVTLLCSVGCAAFVSHAQGATIGKTVVTSAQHEPLAASITVTDIQAADFSANLASSVIYQQMGLSPTDSMTVRFQPTSATSGQVVISTSQPVSKPFADVVLAINDHGQRTVVPKTLLMPLNANLPLKSVKTQVTDAKKPNLPRVSASAAKPLTVRTGAPPPLVSTPKHAANQSQAPEWAAEQLPASRTKTAIQAPLVTSSMPVAPTLQADDTRRDTARHSEGSSLPTNNSDPTAVPDKQLDILNIQVTRQIQPKGQATPMSALSSPDTLIDRDDGSALAAVNATPTPNTAASVTAAASHIPAETAILEQSASHYSAPAADSHTPSASAQYQVQRNDSLWVIAQHIAQKNNIDIQTVMQEIQSQNPDAFINKNADQLKADAKLRLPNYDIIPSQQKLEAAISAQRQYRRQSKAPVIKKSPPAVKTPATTRLEADTSSTPIKKPMIKKTQMLPKAQFSVLAPDHGGQADGTQSKSAATTGNGLSTDILATLKASRQATAEQAQRLSKTSDALDSYTKKIQLQNQKLAELQARLQKLRNQ